jgi:translation initiation factor IF-2
MPEEKPDLFRAGSAEWENLQDFRVRQRAERPRQANGSPATPSCATKPRRKVLKLFPGLTVKAFAEMVGQRPADVQNKLMETRLMLTLNQPIPQDAAVLLAEGFGVKAERHVVKEGDDLLVEVLGSAGNHALLTRPPVVTIMGHVDHGKTSLLDAIRQTRLTEQEAGGITQRIGAYTVRVGDKHVTFIDTPGHEAFTAMRARGAKATDIVVLVVAADDGVMPQTIEAIHHAAAAQVPILVAINKMDKPDANPERVKHAIADHGLISEAWGGKTIVVEVSALHKRGLDTLLEMILLQAEIMELKASPSCPALGVVLEAKLDRHRGPVATVLVHNGTLRVGDAFVVGAFSGRVRAMISDTGAQLLAAGPSTPVEVLGLPGVPGPGEQFVVVKDEGVAREIAEGRLQRQRSVEQAARGSRYTLEDLSSRMKEQSLKELSLLIKADLRGSAEALSEAIRKLSTDAVRVQILYTGVGGITESDVLLAAASQAIIIGFAVRPEPKAMALAEREGVEIRLYTIIYEAVADIKAAMEGLLEPTWKERILGHAVIRQIFTVPKVGVVTGCYVTDGVITRANTQMRVIRDQVTIHEGPIGSLRRFKDDVREVQQGYECGIAIENSSDLKVGDVLEAFVLDRELVRL